MPFLEFSGCADRIYRARELRKDLADHWSTFLDDDPYDAWAEVSDDGAGVLTVAQRYDPFPTIFSLRFGEIVYHLRACLDACVYGAAIRDGGREPPPDVQKLAFPICSTAEFFVNAAGKIGPLAQERRAIIEAVQPYNARESVPDEQSIHKNLGILNELARRDRHRVLAVIGSREEDIQPKFRIKLPARVVEIRVIDTVLFLEDNAEVAHFRVEGWKPGMKIDANPNLSIDIALNEPGIGDGRPMLIGPLTHSLIEAVYSVTTAIEDSFH